VQLQWSPFIGVPLLAMFSRSNEPLILYCKFRNETAYATAFSRLFAILEQRREAQPECQSFVEQPLVN
jgi:hypothetical protein